MVLLNKNPNGAGRKRGGFRMARKRWSNNQDKIGFKLFKEGCSEWEIARVLKRTTKAIKARRWNVWVYYTILNRGKEWLLH